MTDLADYANLIVRHAQGDGALIYGSPSDAVRKVNPYFANLASIGLCDAYIRIKDDRYVETVKNWVTWYITYAERTGGIISDYKSSGNGWIEDTDRAPPYVSVDSYIATFLTVVYRVMGDAYTDVPWRNRVRKFLPKALDILRQTIQRTGPTADLAVNLLAPTLNRPQACYTEDNCEVWVGLRAAQGMNISVPGLFQSSKRRALWRRSTRPCWTTAPSHSCDFRLESRPRATRSDMMTLTPTSIQVSRFSYSLFLIYASTIR